MSDNSGLDIAQEHQDLTGKILKAAYAVHSYCGPGLMESAYRDSMIDELKDMGLKVESEVIMPFNYKGHVHERAYVIDLIVENEVIIELKCVAKLQSVHRSQVRTYLKSSNLPVGLLINFFVDHLTEGIQRIIVSDRGV